MERLLAIYVNDKRLFNCAISLIGESASITRPNEKGYFGVGYYSDGEVLLRKHPLYKELLIDESFSETKSNFLLLAFNTDISEPFKIENIQPFRFRNWLSAISSDYSPDENFFKNIAEHIPEYIYKNIKSRRWEEFVFHLFLAYLHDKNKLDSMFLSQETMYEAIEFSVFLLPRLFGSSGIESLPHLTWVLTNGDIIGAITTSENLAFQMYVSGIEKCFKCSDERFTPYHDPKIIDHPHAKLFFLTAGHETSHPEFQPLKKFSIILVGSEGNITEYVIKK